MQITWLPIQGPEQKAAKAKALEYMSAILRAFTPTFTKAQSQQKLQKLLTAGKNKRYYADTEGAVRYVVSRHMVNELVANLRKELAGVTGCAVAIAPPDMYLDLAKRAADGSHIILGAQNVDVNLSGAFTGETSAEMLKDIGAKYIIIGHSERRTYHKESDEFIAKKFAVLKEQGLIPVLCIGVRRFR